MCGGTPVSKMHYPQMATTSRPAAALLIFAVVTAGAPEVWTFAGMPGVAAYWSLGALVMVGRRWIVKVAGRFASPRAAPALLLAAVVTIAVAFAVLYPIANAGGPRTGGDSDDALMVAGAALLHGQYPYAQRTYLHNPVTYLPGSFAAALPFVLLGNVGWQGVFWLGLFALVVRAAAGDTRRALLIFVACLGSVQVWHALVTGAEMLASGIYVSIAVWYAVRMFLPSSSARQRIGAALLLGVSVCCRANYFLALPIVYAAAWRDLGWKEAATLASMTLAVLVVLIVPFALIDPPVFWRAVVVEQNLRAAGGGTLMRYLQNATPILAAALAAVATWQSYRAGSASVLVNCAAAQVALVLVIAASDVHRLRHTPFFWLRYDLHGIFFAALALASGVSPPASRELPRVLRVSPEGSRRSQYM